MGRMSRQDAARGMTSPREAISGLAEATQAGATPVPEQDAAHGMNSPRGATSGPRHATHTGAPPMPEQATQAGATRGPEQAAQAMPAGTAVARAKDHEEVSGQQPLGLGEVCKQLFASW